MASELDYDKLVKLVKSDNDITQGKAAERLGLSIGQIPMLKFCLAKVEAGVVSKAPGTDASIKRLRQGGARFELIAAQTGKSVAAVKAVLGDDAGYVGRGRDHSNGASSGTSRKGSSKTTSTGSRKTTSTGTSRKKTSSTGTARKKTASARGNVVRNTRRSGGRATNPS